LILTVPTFDAHAANYDDVAESALGRELRRRVRSRVTPYLNAEAVVMDLGCGSGLDAAWMAPQVRQIFAIDPSSDMVALTAEACSRFRNVVVARGDGSQLVSPQPLDLLLANFGVINCVGDLHTFSDGLDRVLKPGGHAVLVTMARWCPAEIAVGTFTLNRDLLRRRRRKAPSNADYAGLDLRYAGTGELHQALGDRFELVAAESLGLTLPPFEQRAWLENRPRLLRRLARADERLSTLGARLGVGDHHIVVIRKPKTDTALQHQETEERRQGL